MHIRSCNCQRSTTVWRLNVETRFQLVAGHWSPFILDHYLLTTATYCYPLHITYCINTYKLGTHIFSWKAIHAFFAWCQPRTVHWSLVGRFSHLHGSNQMCMKCESPKSRWENSGKWICKINSSAFFKNLFWTWTSSKCLYSSTQTRWTFSSANRVRIQSENCSTCHSFLDLSFDSFKNKPFSVTGCFKSGWWFV